MDSIGTHVAVCCKSAFVFITHRGKHKGRRAGLDERTVLCVERLLGLKFNQSHVSRSHEPGSFHVYFEKGSDGQYCTVLRVFPKQRLQTPPGTAGRYLSSNGEDTPKQVQGRAGKEQWFLVDSDQKTYTVWVDTQTTTDERAERAACKVTT